MQVHFINVGYGEAILIQTAQGAGSVQGSGSSATQGTQRDGFAVLIDGGTNRAEEYDHPGCIRALDYLKKIGVSRLDLVIVTHIHDDHIGGIPDIIRNLNVSEVWINLKPAMPDLDKINRFKSVISGNLSGALFRNALRSYADLLRECESRGIPVLQKGAGGFFPLTKGSLTKGSLTKGSCPELPDSENDSYIQLLAPDEAAQAELLGKFERLASKIDPDKDDREAEALFYEIDKGGNSSSIALIVKAGQTGALLTGDKVDGWEEIRGRYGAALESQILKVTHHGQLDGMPREMLEAAQPDIFVICADKDRRFDSAHPALIERANTFLKEKGKTGGVYITGSLEPEAAGGKECCAVCFLCDEESGEITPRLIEI